MEDREVLEVIVQQRFTSPLEEDALRDRLRGSGADFDARLRLVGTLIMSCMQHQERQTEAVNRYIDWVVPNVSRLAAGRVAELLDAHLTFVTPRLRLYQFCTQLLSHDTRDLQLQSSFLNYFLMADAAVHQQLLARCLELDPTNVRWMSGLAAVYEAEVSDVDRPLGSVASYWDEATPPVVVDSAKKAIELLSSALVHCGGSFVSLALQVRRARMCFLSRKFDSAMADLVAVGGESAATSGARDEEDIWRYFAHQLRGRLAIRQGNVHEAENECLRSVENMSGPRAQMVAPTMMLAEELVLHGSIRCVQDYLNRCEIIWPQWADRLREWKQQVESGATPRFDHRRPLQRMGWVMDALSILDLK